MIAAQASTGRSWTILTRGSVIAVVVSDAFPFDLSKNGYNRGWVHRWDLAAFA